MRKVKAFEAFADSKVDCFVRRSTAVGVDGCKAPPRVIAVREEQIGAPHQKRSEVILFFPGFNTMEKKDPPARPGSDEWGEPE